MYTDEIYIDTPISMLEDISAPILNCYISVNTSPNLYTIPQIYSNLIKQTQELRHLKNEVYYQPLNPNNTASAFNIYSLQSFFDAFNSSNNNSSTKNIIYNYYNTLSHSIINQVANNSFQENISKFPASKYSDSASIYNIINKPSQDSPSSFNGKLYNPSYASFSNEDHNSQNTVFNNHYSSLYTPYYMRHNSNTIYNKSDALSLSNFNDTNNVYDNPFIYSNNIAHLYNETPTIIPIHNKSANYLTENTSDMYNSTYNNIDNHLNINLSNPETPIDIDNIAQYVEKSIINKLHKDISLYGSNKRI